MLFRFIPANETQSPLDQDKNCFEKRKKNLWDMFLFPGLTGTY